MHNAESFVDFNTTKLLNAGVSEDELRDFLRYWQRFNLNHSHVDENEECKDYCKSELYQLLRAYNGVHGYVALLVS